MSTFCSFLSHLNPFGSKNKGERGWFAKRECMLASPNPLLNGRKTQDTTGKERERKEKQGVGRTKTEAGTEIRVYGKRKEGKKTIKERKSRQVKADMRAGGYDEGWMDGWMDEETNVSKFDCKGSRLV